MPNSELEISQGPMDQPEHASFFVMEGTAGESQEPETARFSEPRDDGRESIDLAHQKDLMRAAGMVIGVSDR